MSLELDFTRTSIRSVISCFPPNHCETHESVPLYLRAGVTDRAPEQSVVSWNSVSFMCVLLRAAGALGGEAEEGALHERERHAAERAAGPQRLHVSAAPGATLPCSLLLVICFPQLMFSVLWQEHPFNYYNTGLFLLFCGFCLGR